jgi:hypothetical protein
VLATLRDAAQASENNIYTAEGYYILRNYNVGYRPIGAIVTQIKVTGSTYNWFTPAAKYNENLQ